jgi:protocatechuate 3,4-dioxygenase beta subunit
MHRESHRENHQRLASGSLLLARRVPRRTALSGGLATLALAALGCSAKRSGGEGSPQVPGATAGAGGAQPGLAGGGAAQPSQPLAGGAAQPAMPAMGSAGMIDPAAGAMAPSMTNPGGMAGAPTAGMPNMSNMGGMPAAMGGSGGTAGMAMPTGLDALQCIVTPAMTAGPFFVDEKLNRSNLLMDETDDAIVNAVPLKLVIGVFEVSGGMCKPLSGVQVDIWHANALGVYSDVAAGVVQSVDTRGKKFLRGYQLSDEQGIVRFETIYPGWYRSRAIHIHFKLRMLGSGAGAREFISQMFFDETINSAVLAMGAYSDRTDERSVLNDDDHIYNGTATNGQRPPAGTTPPGKDIIPVLVADGGGYTGTLKIGLQA